MKTKPQPLNLPSKLRAWRKRLKLTQSRAAVLAGADVRTWQNWEQGRNTPRGLALSALLERIKQ